jgi:hypothetical protein
MNLVPHFPLRPLRTDANLDAAVAVVDSLIDQDTLSAPEQEYLGWNLGPRTETAPLDVPKSPSTGIHQRGILPS